MLQASFATELLRACTSEGFHTSVDTCGQLQWSALERAAQFTGLFLYDLKGVDPECHKANTGASSDRIIDNLRRLSVTGVPIEIRMLIIPGINDSDEQIEAAGRLLGGLSNITGVRLLA